MTDRHGRRIVAVVVTFNRLDLLQRLVERLTGVPELDEVLVVDNASTDGTSEWLASPRPDGFEASFEARKLAPQDKRGARTSTTGTARTLSENTGGAGGFKAGLMWAMERDADLVWLMDDDGLPEPDCLQLLLEQDDLDFWGPVVVDETDPSRLVFPIRLPGGPRVVRTLDEARAAAPDGLIRDVVIPFNGVLVTRDLVDEIGFPRAEFFIWGDDHEYRLRAERAGGRVATVVDARVRHPSVGDLGTPMMFGRTTYNHSPSDLKHYCMARNNTVNLRDYRGWPHVLMFWAKSVWFYLLTRPRPGRVLLTARGAYAGLRGDFTGHRRFLRSERTERLEGRYLA